MRKHTKCQLELAFIREVNAKNFIMQIKKDIHRVPFSVYVHVFICMNVQVQVQVQVYVCVHVYQYMYV